MPVCLNLSCRQMCVVLSEAPPPEERCKQIGDWNDFKVHTCLWGCSLKDPALRSKWADWSARSSFQLQSSLCLCSLQCPAEFFILLLHRHLLKLFLNFHDKGLGEKEGKDRPGCSVFFTVQNCAVMELKYYFLHIKQASMSWEESTAERQK